MRSSISDTAYKEILVMRDILYFILDILPFFIGGFVVFVVMRLKHNEEMRKACLDAYYKGKEDGINTALREQLEKANKANGNKDQH